MFHGCARMSHITHDYLAHGPSGHGQRHNLPTLGASVQRGPGTAAWAVRHTTVRVRMQRPRKTKARPAWRPSVKAAASGPSLRQRGDRICPASWKDAPGTPAAPMASREFRILVLETKFELEVLDRAFDLKIGSRC